MHSLKMVRLLAIRGFRGILITTSLFFTFYSPLMGGCGVDYSDNGNGQCIPNYCKNNCDGKGTCKKRNAGYGSKYEYYYCSCNDGAFNTSDVVMASGTCELNPCISQTPVTGTCNPVLQDKKDGTGKHWTAVVSCPNSSDVVSHKQKNQLNCIKNPCAGITCNDGTNSHGTCQVNDNDQAECACADGYKLSFPNCYKDLCDAEGIKACSPGSCDYVGLKGSSCNCPGGKYKLTNVNNRPACVDGSTAQVWRDCATSNGTPSYINSHTYSQFSCSCPTGMEYSTSASQCISPSSCSSAELILTKGENNKTRCCPNCSGSKAKAILKTDGTCDCVCSGTDIMVNGTCKANPCAAHPTPCGSKGTCTFNTTYGGFSCKCGERDPKDYTDANLRNLCDTLNSPSRSQVIATQCQDSSDCGTNSTCVRPYGFSKCACNSSFTSSTHNGKNCVCANGYLNGTKCAPCPENAASCTSSNNIISCVVGYYLEESTNKPPKCTKCPKGSTTSTGGAGIQACSS